MTTLDEVLSYYETFKQITKTQEIPREISQEECELLNDHINNGNLQAVYDYHNLKDRLDKEWVDGRMWHKLNPYG
jgi:hypothetical protein